jgi:UDP-N-acetylmuramoylalanine--D-glutamate ligase
MSAPFVDERAVVVGTGASGRAAARVLIESGAEVWVTERGDAPRDGEFAALGVPVMAGGHREEHLDGSTLVVTSPGVPEDADILRWASARGLPVWSELELGARLCTVPYVAVTGTNGKTTTTELVASCMRAEGLDAVACGNIGHPFSLAAREGRDALAVEASSFQLRFSHSLRPRVSVLLNVSEDHLDWHGSMERYVEAKARIYRLQSKGDAHVGNRDDARAAALSEAAPCDRVWFGSAEPGPGETGYRGSDLVSRIGGDASLGPVDPARGAGFRADAAAAAAATLAFGLRPSSVAQGIESFTPLPHRGEVVASLHGVRFVDDSKATNPHAVLAALDGLRKVVLIAGGLAKGVDLSPLASAASSLDAVVAIGEASRELVRIFDGLVDVRAEASIEDAVRAASDLAAPGGTVLLAPACASQDMFRDYRERGDRFAAEVDRLAKEDALDG